MHKHTGAAVRRGIWPRLRPWLAYLRAEAVRASMAHRRVLIEAEDGSTRVLHVKLARSKWQRRIGYQHCPARRVVPIWFALPVPGREEWHMEGVHFPLDIVYVAPGGLVVGVERMLPGPARHLSPCPLEAALEVPAGWASELGIRGGVRLLPRPGPRGLPSGLAGGGRLPHGRHRRGARVSGGR